MAAPQVADDHLERPEVILARERSHLDVNTSNEYTKTLVQLVALINGGAATAILTFYGSAKTVFSSTSLLFAAIAICIYCIGIFLAILAGINYRRSISRWSTYWEKKTYWNDRESNKLRIEALKAEADAFSDKGRKILLAGLVCFPAASALMAFSIFIASVGGAT